MTPEITTAAYQLQWPAAGRPQLAARVQSLLTTAGFETATDPQREWSHIELLSLILFGTQRRWVYYAGGDK